MRQFILGAGDVAYATGATPELTASGAVGFYYLKVGISRPFKRFTRLS